MIPPPPRSTLFPYTTLFRSLGDLHVEAAVLGDVHQPSFLPPTQGDRKSTRLNSSHDQSSYAVFCLKKKNRSTVSPAVDDRSPCYCLPLQNARQFGSAYL